MEQFFFHLIIVKMHQVQELKKTNYMIIIIFQYKIINIAVLLFESN